jgi:hypothetical protein
MLSKVTCVGDADVPERIRQACTGEPRNRTGKTARPSTCGRSPWKNSRKAGFSARVRNDGWYAQTLRAEFGEQYGLGPVEA